MDEAKPAKARRAPGQAAAPMTEVQKELADLRRDMAGLAAAFQDLLKTPKSGLGASLKDRREELGDQAAALRDSLDKEVEVLRDYVRTRPIKVLATAGLAGLLFGLLTGRR
jgi:ElaB/YqjD/DUF883 family membrane-anchored ribosome-binding protein